MDILKQALIDFLNRKSNIDLKDIKRELKINNNAEALLLERCLKELEIEGIIFQDHKGLYSLLCKQPNVVHGKVHFLTSGDALITTKDNMQIIIDKKNANGLLDKDIVTVNNLWKDKKNNIYGILYKIVKSKAKNANTIITVAKTKNTGLNLKPEILIQPAASGKHIAKVFDTP